MEILAYCAVNCYALISGYVGISARYRYSNILILWLQVIFYTVGIAIGFAIFRPGSVQGSTWIASIFPIANNQYWYITAYVGLFVLIPVLNIAVRYLNGRQLGLVLILCAMLFSVIPTVWGRDVFDLKNGYSVWWLALLYLFGSFCGKYNIAKRIKKKYIVMAYILSVVGTFILKLVCEPNANHGIGILSYTAPLVVLMSICLMMLFAEWSPNKYMIKIISALAPLTLGVYLVHMNPLLVKILIMNKFTAIANYNVILTVGAAIGIAFVIYIGCSLIDWVRLMIFRKSGIIQLARKIDVFADRYLQSER